MSAAFEDLPDPQDFPLDPDWCDEFLRVVGLLSLRYCALDYELRLWVKSLLGAQFHAGMAFAQSAPYLLMLSDLVSALSSLDADARHREQLQNCLKDIRKKINQQRIELAHQFWSIDKASGKITKIKIRLQETGLKHERKSISVSEMQRRADELKVLLASLESLRQTLQLGAPPAASPTAT